MTPHSCRECIIYLLEEEAALSREHSIRGHATENAKMGQSSSKSEDKSRNDDGNIGRVSKPGNSRSMETSQFEQHVNSYTIYRHGPTDPAAYSIRLYAQELGQSVNPMHKYSLLRPDISCRVIGFAWAALGPDDEANMMALKKWAARDGKLRLPTMCVKLQWQHGHTSWEWQESAKRYLLGTEASRCLIAPESIEYTGVVLVPKNASIQKGDYMIIKSAVELEKEVDKNREENIKKGDGSIKESAAELERVNQNRDDGTHEHVSGVERLDNISWMVLNDPKTAVHHDDTAIDLKAVLFDSDSSLVIWDRWGERSKLVPLCGRTVGDALHKIHEIYTRANDIYERTHDIDADCMDTSETDFEMHGWYVDTLWFERIRRTDDDPNVWNVEYGT